MTWNILQAINAVLSPSANMTPTERLVTLALARYCDDTGACWPSHATLAADSGLSRRAVVKVLHRLRGRVDLPVTITWHRVSRRASCRYSLSLFEASSSEPRTPLSGEPDAQLSSAHRSQLEPSCAPDDTRVVNVVPSSSEPGAHYPSIEQTKEPFALVPSAPSPPKRKRRASSNKGERAANPDVPRLRNCWVEAFKAATGGKPTLTRAQWPRAMRAFREILDVVDFDRAASAIRNALSDDWTRAHRPLPWEIGVDLSKHLQPRARGQQGSADAHELDNVLAKASGVRRGRSEFESKVVELVDAGEATRDIAEQLGVSPAKVSRARSKLGITTRARRSPADVLVQHTETAAYALEAAHNLRDKVFADPAGAERVQAALQQLDQNTQALLSIVKTGA